MWNELAFLNNVWWKWDLAEAGIAVGLLHDVDDGGRRGAVEEEEGQNWDLEKIGIW